MYRAGYIVPSLLLLVTGLCAPASAQSSQPGITGGFVADGVPTAQAAYKRRVESVEQSSRKVAGHLAAAAESAAGSPAAGGPGSQPRSAYAPLPGCYNHLIAADDGRLRYGHICPGLGGYGGGAGAELFGVGVIEVYDPETGQVTARIPVEDLGPGATPTITISTAMLAQFALADLALPSPTLEFSPDGDQITQLPSWLWIDRDAWGARDKTATAGPVSATVTATPLRVEWDMGNGDVVVCSGPGRVYEARFAERPEATNCRYTYRHSSANEPSLAYGVTATVVWSASWSGSDGAGGDLGELTSATTEAVRVAEVQALVQ